MSLTLGVSEYLKPTLNPVVEPTPALRLELP